MKNSKACLQAPRFSPQDSDQVNRQEMAEARGNLNSPGVARHAFSGGYYQDKTGSFQALPGWETGRSNQNLVFLPLIGFINDESYEHRFRLIVCAIGFRGAG